MLPASEDDAAKGRHVREVAPECQSDVLVRWAKVIGRIEVDPSMLGYPHGYPRVRCVSTDKPRMPGRGPSSQVATNVARRQTHLAQATQHHVTEVLTNTPPTLQDLPERGRLCRCS